MTPNDDELLDSSFDPAEAFFRSILASLRNDGPAVNATIIVAYIEQDLSAERMEQVRRLIHTCKNWHDMYVVLVHDSLDEELDEHPANETPVPERIKRIIGISAGSDNGSDEQASGANISSINETINVQVETLAYDNKSRDYLQRPDARLITHPSFMTVAHRSGGSPLDPYMEGLEKLICKDWKWEQQRQKPELLDDVYRVRVVASLIQASDLNIPFDSQLVAAILVKAGLDQLCHLT